jgi:hypothetical protein
MSQDTMNGLIQLLGKYDPLWVAIILAVVILCYKSPEIIKAFRSRHD